jgi:cobalt/nickel transport system ATP-binding protein
MESDKIIAQEIPVFEVDKLTYHYGEGQNALDGVSLTIGKGESVAILGSNGCGKSTLLKLLDGLYYPVSGSIKAFGQPLCEANFQDESFNHNFRRQVSLVFQDSDVQLFSPSVWDEVAFAPLQLGLETSEVERRVSLALEALRIEKLRNRPPHRLSSGEKKRVALASVLSLNPPVWLMDEPTAGLDPRSQSWLIDFILEQRKAGKTMITTTHDLGLAESIADRIYILDEEHRLAAEGKPETLLNNTDLLIACNLVHEHRHRHGDQPEHTHLHRHSHAHSHPHTGDEEHEPF